VEDFNRLQQTGSLDDCIAKFEELKALLIMTNPTMPESYFLESFIGGLKAAVKPLVRAFNPRTLDDVMEQARFQEDIFWPQNAPRQTIQTFSLFSSNATTILSYVTPYFSISTTKSLTPYPTLFYPKL